jgi:hypothetical protein
MQNSQSSQGANSPGTQEELSPLKAEVTHGLESPTIYMKPQMQDSVVEM